MIEGVVYKKLVKYCDDRGTFMEILRADDGILQRFGQASISMSYPGVIKAFHYHERQDDVWYFPIGNAQVVLYDLRKASSTRGETDVYYMGEENPSILLIPKGVVHGYRVLGQVAATILYFTTQAYDSEQPDEYRFSYDDPQIDFNWQTKFR
jgi:dTDP-4-dehydrorhamnose 3,5-epimerase